MRAELLTLARGARRRLRGLLRNGSASASASAPRILGTDEIASLPREAIEQACRALVCPAYLGDDTALCRILTRYKIYVDTRDIMIAAHLLLEGFWESWLTQFMARLVKPGWTVADVGAHYGYYTLLLADLVGPGGRVIAVEPNPEAAGLLERSVLLNGFAGRTRIRRAAAGAVDGGTVTLLVPRTMTGGAAVSASAGVELADFARHEVEETTLDRLLGGEGRIDFLKIDAEGSEERILAGMERIFATARPPMVLEFNPARYADAKGFLERLVDLYGPIREVDFGGEAAAVEPERVLGEPVEWLLFLSRD